MLVEILVSVKRPVTSEGRMSNVTPFPFDVEIFVFTELSTVPPLRAPPAPITHEPPVFVALKLPLLCAKAIPVNAMPATKATVTVSILFIAVGLLLIDRGHAAAIVLGCNACPARASREDDQERNLVRHTGGP